MANKEIHDLITAEQLSSSDVVAEQRDGGGGTWLTRKFTLDALGLFLNKVHQYASDLHTTSKTIIGAINEVHDNSTSPALDDLSDVDIDSSTLAAGQTIIYNGTSGKFENASTSGGSHSYSTTEQVVGTWIDGSTLYEKTFEYSGSYTGSVDLTNQFSGIDECFITEAFCINQSDAILPLPYSHTSSGNTITLFINSTKTGFGIRVGADQTLSRIVIVMRYTKSSS